ncbi:MAG: ATP-binding cassette domain-containing protein [Burkholderiales bacterium]
MIEPAVQDAILEVRNLHVVFATERGSVHAVRGVSFYVSPGQTLGIVSESGCGKSVTCMALLKLLPETGRAVGEAWLGKRNLLELSATELDRVRGHEIAMIFQDPAASLNPVHAIGRQIMESLRLHRGMNRLASLHRRPARLDAAHRPHG